MALTRIENAQPFLKALKHNLEGIETVAVHRSRGFSWSSCDSCGSTLGGSRHRAEGLTRDAETDELDWIELSICIDCAMFHANGELPEEWSRN